MAWKGVHLTKPRGSRLPTANAASSRMTVKSAIGREPLVRFGPTISPIKPTTGKSVGKPRLLPKCHHTHAQPTTGKSVGKPRRRNTNPEQTCEPTTRKSVGKPASQMRMEAETGTRVTLRPQRQTFACEKQKPPRTVGGNAIAFVSC